MHPCSRVQLRSLGNMGDQGLGLLGTALMGRALLGGGAGAAGRGGGLGGMFGGTPGWVANRQIPSGRRHRQTGSNAPLVTACATHGT